jgi:hypothetical protein
MTCPIILRCSGNALTNRCLVPNGGIHLTEPLPCNDGRDTHKGTKTDGRIYEVRRIGSRVQNLMGGGDSQTHTG